MSLNKAIEHGKEKRKPYYRSKRFDRSCRNHGGCPYCLDNRFHSTKVKEEACKQQVEESIYEENVGTRQLESLYEEISSMTIEEYNSLLERICEEDSKGESFFNDIE